MISLSLSLCAAELPENGRGDLLLSEEYLRNCMNIFSVPSRGLETNSRTFPLKHLNIIDPLRENNNLGRSVNKGIYLFFFLNEMILYQFLKNKMIKPLKCGGYDFFFLI